LNNLTTGSDTIAGNNQIIAENNFHHYHGRNANIPFWIYKNENLGFCDFVILDSFKSELKEQLIKHCLPMN
jgi:hypothetical protein